MPGCPGDPGHPRVPSRRPAPPPRTVGQGGSPEGSPARTGKARRGEGGLWPHQTPTTPGPGIAQGRAAKSDPTPSRHSHRPPTLKAARPSPTPPTTHNTTPATNAQAAPATTRGPGSRPPPAPTRHNPRAGTPTPPAPQANQDPPEPPEPPDRPATTAPRNPRTTPHAATPHPPLRGSPAPEPPPHDTFLGGAGVCVGAATLNSGSGVRGGRAVGCIGRIVRKLL